MAARDIDKHGGRCTLSALADVCRGIGGAQYKVADDAGRPSSATARIDLAALGGKVELSRENAERLLVQMLLAGYLTESFHATAYTVNVYLAPGRLAGKLAQYALRDAQHLQGTVRLVLHDATMDVAHAEAAPRPAPKRAGTRAPAGAKRARRSTQEDGVIHVE